MKKLVVLFTFVIASSVQAINLQIGKALPEVNLTEGGELVIVKDEIKPQGWSSKTLAGKVRVLQHIAGRSKVKEKNDPLMEAIKKAKFSTKTYQTTNIINADDVLMGTSYFVKRSAEEAKRANAHSQIVLDNNGSIQKAWDLKPQESLIVVLDKKGNVQYFFEGQLNQQQITEVLTLVKELQGR